MKKRNICSISILLLLLVGCALLLLACNEAVDPCAAGHTEVTDAGVPATCSASGLSDGKHCSVCNKVLIAQEWINKLDHTASEWQITLGATCGQPGSQYRKCTACDVILETQNVDAIAHQYGEPQTTKAPTCISSGEQSAVCALCDDVKITSLSALSHEALDWTADPAHPASCVQNGVEVRTCKHCGITLELRVAQKLAHVYPEAWTTTIPPTCAVMGQQQRACTACGYVQKSDLATLSHTPGEWTIVLQETETTNGSKTLSCTTCQNIIKLEIIPSTIAPIQLTYTIEDGKVTVTGYTARADKALVIPAELDGYPVAKIAAGAFRNATAFTSITLPASLETIEAGAFEGSSLLTHRNGLMTIGEWLISVDPDLNEITIPTTLTKIAQGALASAYKLIHITNLSAIALTDLPANPGLEIRTSTSEAFQNAVTAQNGLLIYTVGDAVYLFGYTGKSETLDLTNTGVTAIYPHALLNHETIKVLVIPEAITEIGENAFGGCHIETLSATMEGLKHVPTTHLRSLTVTGSPTEIPSNFLSGCVTLEEISLPNTILVTRKMAFVGCTNVTSLTCPADMLSTDLAQNFSKLEKLTVNGGTAIPTKVFMKHTALREVHIAPSITTINAQAFYNCSALEVFVFDDIENSNLKTLGNYQFCSDVNLTSIELPPQLTKIPPQCFSGCSALVSITIPNSVTSISYEAFQSCTSLLSVTIPASVVTLENYADTNVRGVFEGCTSLQEVIFESGSQLTLISNYCFYNCKSLTSITIPKSVTSIGMKAFYGTDVTSVTFENTSNWKTYSIKTVSSQVLSTGFQNLGTGTALTSEDLNAVMLTSTYVNYVWKRD